MTFGASNVHLVDPALMRPITSCVVSPVLLTGTTWVDDILIDLSTDDRPEWCEVCGDLDPDQVPARATRRFEGIMVCDDCYENRPVFAFGDDCTTEPTKVDDLPALRCRS